MSSFAELRQALESDLLTGVAPVCSRDDQLQELIERAASISEAARGELVGELTNAQAATRTTEEWLGTLDGELEPVVAACACPCRTRSSATRSPSN